MNYVELYHSALLSKDSIDYGWPNRIGYLARINEEEKKMTKEEALQKIEELKAFVEKLDEEIPEMSYDENSTNQIVLGRHLVSFNSLDTRECYRIKAFELAHLMYAREHLKFELYYFCNYRLYFDSYKLEYNIIKFDHPNIYVSSGIFESINHWLFPDEDSARKVAKYMNKYVKDTVKKMMHDEERCYNE